MQNWIAIIILALMLALLSVLPSWEQRLNVQPRVETRPPAMVIVVLK